MRELDSSADTTASSQYDGKPSGEFVIPCHLRDIADGGGLVGSICCVPENRVASRSFWFVELGSSYRRAIRCRGNAVNSNHIRAGQPEEATCRSADRKSVV